jgi:uncharacterized protein YeaO (DUF488 family)
LRDPQTGLRQRVVQELADPPHRLRGGTRQPSEALVAASIVFERRRSGPVTLLYAARDEHRNNAVALKLWLDQQAPAP